MRTLAAWSVLLLFYPPTQAFAQLSINFIAVNASEREAKEIEVKYPIPRELEPTDVVDTGLLKLEYDVEKGVYYVHGTFRFEPKESRTYKIKVRDVFHITEQEVNILKKQLNDNLNLLKDSENFASAKVAKEKLDQQLDYILSQQTSYSDNIERRIEEYRSFVVELERIRTSAYDILYLEHESKAIAEMEKSKETVKLMIEVSNPTKDQSRKIQQKHYLPKEVRANDVVESRGFVVRFDEKKDASYLAKEEEFGPGEKKRYEIVIRDVWKFPIARIDDLEKRTKLALQELMGSVYEPSAKFLSGNIDEKVKEIRDSQGLALGPEQHIGVFRLNEGRYTDAKNNVERLEKMLSIVRAKKLKEMDVGRVQNVLQKLKALRGLAALSAAIFKKGISVTLTWKIIFGVIAFVGLFSTVHFLIWAKRSKAMGEESAPKGGEGIKMVPPPGQQGTATGKTA